MIVSSKLSDFEQFLHMNVKIFPKNTSLKKLSHFWTASEKIVQNWTIRYSVHWKDKHCTHLFSVRGMRERERNSSSFWITHLFHTIPKSTIVHMNEWSNSMKFSFVAPINLNILWSVIEIDHLFNISHSLYRKYAKYTILTLL